MKVFVALLVLVSVVCAKQSGPARISFPTGRVVGGENAKPHSAPFIVSLQSGYHFCAGSIVSEQIIVTAAHCIQASSCTSIQVIAGLHDLRDTKGSQSRHGKTCVTHEKYGSGVGPYDVGLIFLDEPLDLSDKNVAAIALPKSGKIHAGDVVLFGWGSTSTGIFPTMPNILQTVTKPIVPYDECENVLGGPGASPLHPTNICTGPLTGGISACSGDSGGPLTQAAEDGTPELCGIVSWGYIPCGSRNAPSVYTRTSAHIEWIKKHANDLQTPKVNSLCTV